MARKAEVTGMRLEPLDKGGVVSHLETRVKRSGQGGGPDYDHDTERVGHPTLEHLQKHVAKHMGAFFDGDEEGEGEGDKGKVTEEPKGGEKD
jgi:hypothetical protein